MIHGIAGIEFNGDPQRVDASPFDLFSEKENDAKLLFLIYCEVLHTFCKSALLACFVCFRRWEQFGATSRLYVAADASVFKDSHMQNSKTIVLKSRFIPD